MNTHQKFFFDLWEIVLATSTLVHKALKYEVDQRVFSFYSICLATISVNGSCADGQFKVA